PEKESLPREPPQEVPKALQVQVDGEGAVPAAAGVPALQTIATVGVEQRWRQRLGGGDIPIAAPEREFLGQPDPSADRPGTNPLKLELSPVIFQDLLPIGPVHESCSRGWVARWVSRTSEAAIRT